MNKRRPKHNFTDRDLDRVLLTLWTRDDLIFIPSDIESRSPSLYICTTGPGPESVHSTRGKEAAPDKSKTDFVRSLYLLILERGRLAQKMAADYALKAGRDIAGPTGPLYFIRTRFHRSLPP